MKRSSHESLSMLVRWREFQESRASSEFQRSFAETRKSQAGVGQAAVAMEDIREYQVAFLRSPQLDLEILQVVADVAQGALQRLEDAQADQAAASQRQDEAQAQHVAARAKTRVVEGRRQRADLARREQAEKLEFDRMADLHVQVKRARS